MTFDYGMKDKNPIDEMRFYTKQNPTQAMRVGKDQVSQMLPHTFIEKSMRVYCKKLDKASLKMAKRYIHSVVVMMFPIIEFSAIPELLNSFHVCSLIKLNMSISIMMCVCVI